MAIDAKEQQLSAQERIRAHRAVNLLSLDGGGVCGALQTAFLDRFQEEYSKFWRNLDLIVGVSTGAIPALCLAAGRLPPVDRKRWVEAASFVFAGANRDNPGDLQKTAGAKYSNKHLRRLLTLQFGGMTLRDLDKKVAIVTFELDNAIKSQYQSRTWKHKIFHNFPGEGSDGDELVVNVALRSTASPGYFPAYKGHCDAGMALRNPAMVGVAQALDCRAIKANLNQLRILSLGAGRSERYIRGQDLDWGVSQWGSRLPHLAAESPAGVVTFQCEQLFKERFHRLDPRLKGTFALDNWHKVPKLIKVAEKSNLNFTLEWLQEYWI